MVVYSHNPLIFHKEGFLLSFLMYSTDGCHLCDVAEQLLIEVLDCTKHQVDVVDIAFDDQLLEKYGATIPVLIDEASQEALYWPFDQEQLEQFVDRVSAIG